MARELLVMWAARRQRREWEDLCARYRERIQRWVTVRDLPIRVRGRGQGARRLEEEGRAMLEALPDPCWVVSLEERGRQRSSRAFARRLGKLVDEWPHPVAFLVGSDLGLAPAVRERSREHLSLGPMTLPHELARLVLYEQLFRAFSIRAGIKYHRQL